MKFLNRLIRGVAAAGVLTLAATAISAGAASAATVNGPATIAPTAGGSNTPFTVGTMRTDTLMFGLVLVGTILLVGALLFLPAAALGPVAEHLGPLPFGG